jgi:outer membrane lipoprotein SlyB
MKRLILLVSIVCAACDSGGVMTTIVSDHPAIVQSYTNENFSTGGAAAGALLGHAMGHGAGGIILWGAAMGAAAADGCMVTVELVRGGTLRLKSDQSMCTQQYVGQHVVVHERKTTETYKDGSSFVWQDEWSW